jgi:hypothetical protein
MPTPPGKCPPLLPALVALLAGLVLAGAGRAAPPNKKPPPPPAKEAPEPAKKVAEEDRKAEKRHKALEEARKKAAEAARRLVREEFKGNEAEALKEAYILLAAANHDYDGHRGRAMHEVEEACNILDVNLLKHGSVAQKIKALQDDQAAAAAKTVSKGTATAHEVQAVSDAQLLNAGAIIKEVAAALDANKQPRVLEHAEAALKELELALTTR